MGHTAVTGSGLGDAPSSPTVRHQLDPRSIPPGHAWATMSAATSARRTTRHSTSTAAGDDAPGDGADHGRAPGPTGAAARRRRVGRNLPVAAPPSRGDSRGRNRTPRRRPATGTPSASLRKHRGTEAERPRVLWVPRMSRRAAGFMRTSWQPTTAPATYGGASNLRTFWQPADHFVLRIRPQTHRTSASLRRAVPGTARPGGASSPQTAPPSACPARAPTQPERPGTHETPARTRRAGVSAYERGGGD